MASLGKLQTSTIGRRESPELDADEMIAGALARAGRKDFSDRSFVDPLRRLVRSYNSEADLSAFGRRAVYFDVMRALKNLIRFDRMEEARPEILSRPIRRPIFITGLPRSGTTFLHTLLAQDPGIAVPLSWQLVYPYPSRLGALGADFRSSWVDMQFQVMLLLSPELKDLHPLSANTPQECTDITAQVFQSLRFDSTYRIPSYQDWLGHHGHHDAYRFHRRFLQHLDFAGSRATVGPEIARPRFCTGRDQGDLSRRPDRLPPPRSPQCSRVGRQADRGAAASIRPQRRPDGDRATGVIFVDRRRRPDDRRIGA